MTIVRRLSALTIFGLALSAYWYVQLLAGGPADPTVLPLTIAVQIGGPLLAAIGCFVAAQRGERDDRLAWAAFGAGSLFYFAGNLGNMVYALAGIDPSFPSFLEGSYFVMAGLFAFGMFQYSKLRQRTSRVQFYNFVLIYSGLTLALLLAMQHAISVSALAPFGTVVAIAYPALWFSIAGFGIMSLVLYDQRDKTFPFALMVAAVSAEAVADLAYAQQRLTASYELGGITQVLWVASTGLILWAAVEQMMRLKRGTMTEAIRRTAGRTMAQATVPAVAIATVLVASVSSGVLADSGYSAFAVALALLFAIVSGLREHWIIETQRQLRRRVEDSGVALSKTRERLTSVLLSTSDSVLVLDRDWRIEFFNENAVQTIGAGGRLELGASFWELMPELSEAASANLFRDAMRDQRPVELEIFYRVSKLWLELHVNPAPGGLSIFFRDISERRRVREEIFHMAHHDPLTGTANRTLFHQKLNEAATSGKGSATLLIDLDHFKEVNDSLGHPVGDRVLSETADRLRPVLRPQDTLARLGGDEFAIILPGCTTTAEVTRVAREILRLASMPCDIDGRSVAVGASVGIVIDDGQSGDADRILRAADIALYAAKSDARGTFRFFEGVMEVDLLRRQALRRDLASALERGEFELVYQPLVDLRSNTVCGFEALLRWRHPDLGMVSPDVFIPIAEETGLINEIGAWVLDTACAEAAKWPDGISVAVNLSPKQFRNGSLAVQIEATMRAAQLPNHKLELEITESVLLDDTRANMATLLDLRDLGLRIALDDFGTGYSSLGYLQRFPFSKIKIDRSFIRGLPENEESKAIVKLVIGLGKSLGMRVTAEGVETKAQLAWVKRGCDEAQGYLLSKPVAPSEIPALIERLGAPTSGRVLQAAG